MARRGLGPPHLGSCWDRSRKLGLVTSRGREALLEGLTVTCLCLPSLGSVLRLWLPISRPSPPDPGPVHTANDPSLPSSPLSFFSIL